MRSDNREVPASDEFSLALGRAVAAQLLADDERVRTIGLRNLTRARAQHAEEPPWVRRWQALLDGPQPELIETLTSSDDIARALRQSSPFAGVLAPRVRWRLLRQVKEARRATRSA